MRKPMVIILRMDVGSPKSESAESGAQSSFRHAACVFGVGKSDLPLSSPVSKFWVGERSMTSWDMAARLIGLDPPWIAAGLG